MEDNQGKKTGKQEPINKPKTSDDQEKSPLDAIQEIIVPTNQVSLLVEPVLKDQDSTHSNSDNHDSQVWTIKDEWKGDEKDTTKTTGGRHNQPEKSCFSCGSHDHIIKDCLKGNNLLVKFYYHEDAIRRNIYIMNFVRFGEIKSIRILESQNQPAAFICFFHERSANQVMEEMHSIAPQSRYWEAELAYNKGRHCNYCKERGHTKFKCPRLEQKRMYSGKGRQDADDTRVQSSSREQRPTTGSSQALEEKGEGGSQESKLRQERESKGKTGKVDEKRRKDYSDAVKTNNNAMEEELKSIRESIRESQAQMGKEVQQLKDMLFKHFGKAESL